MNALKLLSYATQVLGVLPTLIQAGVDVVGFVRDASDKLSAMQAEGRDPTDAEWDTLNRAIADMRAKLHE